VVGPDTKSCQYGIDGFEAGQFLTQWMLPDIYAIKKDGELPVTNEEIAVALTDLGSKLVERL